MVKVFVFVETKKKALEIIWKSWKITKWRHITDDTWWWNLMMKL